MDAAIGKLIRERRDAIPLTRNELGELLGLSAQVYGRYERGFSKMTATRMVHLAELLDFHPIELLGEIAPHFFGENEEDAEKKLQLCVGIFDLPPETAAAFLHIVDHGMKSGKGRALS
ncbi:helix-turn-helix domain-containing protein [Notoacmeibacter ruber]|nr:helix-turn-helix transcriptional regulator [Notoacmeibacter ruber]